MGHKWIIDVLADLRCFAESNELPRLASQLEVVSDMAKSEIHALAQGSHSSPQGDDAGQHIGNLPAQDRMRRGA